MTAGASLPFDDLQRILRLYGSPDSDSVPQDLIPVSSAPRRVLEYAAGVVFTFIADRSGMPTYWTLLLVADARSQRIMTPHQAAQRLLG